MNVRKLLATSAIAASFLAAAPASAVVNLPINGTPVAMSVAGFTFSDTFSFALPVNSNFSGGATSSGFVLDFTTWALNISPVHFTSLVLDGPGSTYDGTYGLGGGTSFASAVNGLMAGTYTFTLNGEAPSGLGAYAVAIMATAVPEPGEWAMMLAGLGMVGFMIRRRKES